MSRGRFGGSVLCEEGSKGNVNTLSVPLVASKQKILRDLLEFAALNPAIKLDATKVEVIRFRVDTFDVDAERKGGHSTIGLGGKHSFKEAILAG